MQFLLPLLAVVFIAIQHPASAQPTQQCFSPEDTREKIEDEELVPMAEIMKIVRSGRSDEVISARLCETNGNLVYMITLLDRSGRVMRMVIDARSGQVIISR